MPGLARKLLIYAAVDGLILQPITQRNQHVGPSVNVDYKTHALSRDSRASRQQRTSECLEAHGIVGLLTVSSSAFLITISKAQQVAQLWDKPIYVIKDIAIIPVNSQDDARNALIESARLLSDSTDCPAVESPSKIAPAFDEADGESFSSLEDTWLDEQVFGQRRSESEQQTKIREPGVAEEIIGRKGVYGRFAESWFSRRGWMTGQRRNQGMSSQDDLTQQRDSKTSRKLSNASRTVATGPFHDPITRDSASAATQVPDDSAGTADDRVALDSDALKSMLPKLLHTVRLLFTSDTFYFSHDFDITRSAGQQSLTASDVLLSKQADPEYFWNGELLKPFIRFGCFEMALPIMQGFVGQRSFVLGPRDSSVANIESNSSTKEVIKASSDELPSIEEVSQSATTATQQDFLLTLISRRSTRRPGLRYLRRGIDDSGNVANSVETEQILSRADLSANDPVFSFLQTRGSLPLYFSQTPYTFKPVPVLHGTKSANQKALKKHFSSLGSRYGEIQAVSLIDKKGVEEAAGKSYEEQVQLLNDQKAATSANVRFKWFDFHHACRGMKFENVSLLIDSLNNFLTGARWTTVQNIADRSSRITAIQSGIVRTNCMDCLDRTNVVQSAIAQHVLSQQLSQALSSPVNLRNTGETSWFNALWADNGDAVSRAYAGTAALKGDYTRTRQRNIRGVLTDFSLTLSRYYRNLFDDFFAQAVIDRLLGNVTDAVFAEFEATMTSADPGIDLDRARQTAIASTSNVVLEQDEDLIAGWALTAPASVAADASLITELRATPFSHVILLLSDQALYRVQYDWDHESVTAFERIALNLINGVQWGTYITETTNKRQKDPSRNVGFLIRFSCEDGRLAKVSTGSLESTTSLHDQRARPNYLAFKALPSSSSSTRRENGNSSSVNESDTVRHICEDITRAYEAKKHHKPCTVPGSSNHEDRDDQQLEQTQVTPRLLKIEQKDLMTLTQAERSTGLVEHIGYSKHVVEFVYGCILIDPTKISRRLSGADLRSTAQ
ncbi:MAG: hypothetical protein M1828_001346 [Chrysothrix sp. TS-e1954]|nr:MAG: hypothetical protein M1828_001346 [Chrysothrix sp. TS-e1954]